MVAQDKTQLTGREPRLSTTYQRPKTGRWQLSPKKLAEALNLLAPESISLSTIEAALHHKEYFVRYKAAQALSRRGDRDARLVMQQVLSEGEIQSRASVARFLHGFSWFAGQPLFRQGLQDEDARVREATIYALCELREIEAFQFMAESLTTEGDTVREAATWGLRDCTDPAAVPVLSVVLQADDPEVRVKALEVLGANGIPEAVPVVEQSIDDTDPEVGYAATLSLLELKEETALVPLSERLYHADSLTRHTILKGFFHATNYLQIDIGRSSAVEEVLDALELVLQDLAPETRLAAIWLLAWTRHERAEIMLQRTYHQEVDPLMKGRILQLAVDLLSPAGPALLEDGLTRQTGHVNEVAQQLHRVEIGG